MELIKQIWKPVLLGAAFGIGILCACLFGVGYLVYNENITQDVIRYALTVSLLLATFSGALYVMAKSRKCKLVGVLSCGAIMFLLLVMINMLLYAEGFSGVGQTALLSIGASITAFLPSLKPKKVRKMKGFKF